MTNTTDAGTRATNARGVVTLVAVLVADVDFGARALGGINPYEQLDQAGGVSALLVHGDRDDVIPLASTERFPEALAAADGGSRRRVVRASNRVAHHESTNRSMALRSSRAAASRPSSEPCARASASSLGASCDSTHAGYSGYRVILDAGV